MGTPEFPNLGKHCNVDDCKLIDFLPFTCDQCNQVFCLEHRSYNKHFCPKANQQDVTVLVCPLCAKGVRLVPNQDPNETWEAHVNTDCDPSNYQKATKKKRCPTPGCKETLTFSNTIRCRDCTQEHCLKHRFGPDHKCPGPKKADTGFPFMGLLKRSQTYDSRPVPSSTKPSPWATNFLNAASSVRASAEAGISRLSIATNQVLQKAREGVGQSSSSSSGGPVEECVKCQARFSSVAALIEHVERVHEGGKKVGPKREVIDVCPKCSRGFQDPVSLVEHVERDHRGSSTV